MEKPSVADWAAWVEAKVGAGEIALPNDAVNWLVAGGVDPFVAADLLARFTWW